MIPKPNRKNLQSSGLTGDQKVAGSIPVWGSETVVVFLLPDISRECQAKQPHESPASGHEVDKKRRKQRPNPGES